MPIAPINLHTNALAQPPGIDTLRPEFAWKLLSAEPDAVQTGYAIQASRTDGFDDALVWDSGGSHASSRSGSATPVLR
jgi:hypothetical protein